MDLMLIPYLIYPLDFFEDARQITANLLLSNSGSVTDRSSIVYYDLLWSISVYYGYIDPYAITDALWSVAVWHGMAWHGMPWNGIAWHGMAWHGMACKAMPCHAMA